MGLYSEQIASRIKKDADSFEKSFLELASVVMGSKGVSESFLTDAESAKGAIDEILQYFGATRSETPTDIEDIDELLELLLRPSGIMRRRVELSGTWYKDGIGPLFGKTTDGRAIAILPGKTSGYTFYDKQRGKRVKITKRNASQINTDAYCFYNPLPSKKLRVSDLLLYMIRSLSVSDYFLAAAITLAVTLLGMLMPYANKQIFDTALASGKVSQLVSTAVLLVGATISTMFINMTKTLIMARIGTKIEMSVQSAAMARLLSLPTSFFRDYNTGEITQKLSSLTVLCGTLISAVLGTTLTFLFSFVYIAQIASFAPSLAVPALMIILANVLLTIANALFGIKTSEKLIQNNGKLSGLVYALFTGVQKIKLAGAEHRAFAKWAKQYATSASLTFSPPWFLRVGPVISNAVFLAGTIILFAIAGTAKVSTADYMAFNASYGMALGAVMSLASIAASISGIKPILNMSKPILEATPEITSDKKMLTHITGAIEINNVSFRYSENMPLVLDDLSLKIDKGQYVAIVGATGCGKSTLLRLLLGFEKPVKGAIYYDRHDMKSVDLKSLRSKIGCVIQNGKLMNGSIFQNIVVAAPWLTLEQAWEAAEIAGIADDIRAMPMGMHTVISEGGASISGGQRQRLMIARAIAPKPKILMFDEATSALDNIAQEHITRYLDRLKCTRIVIAHRLSTIRRCGRIIVLSNGKVVEDGTYDELTALKGRFAELADRQKLENEFVANPL